MRRNSQYVKSFEEICRFLSKLVVFLNFKSGSLI
jgi:hypothetical protein